MSSLNIVAAQRAAQKGFDGLGTVLSGAIGDDPARGQWRFYFIVEIDGAKREFLFRVDKLKSWETDLPLKAQAAADIIRQEKKAEKAEGERAA